MGGNVRQGAGLAGFFEAAVVAMSATPTHGRELVARRSAATFRAGTSVGFGIVGKGVADAGGDGHHLAGAAHVGAQLHDVEDELPAEPHALQDRLGLVLPFLLAGDADQVVGQRADGLVEGAAEIRLHREAVGEALRREAGVGTVGVADEALLGAAEAEMKDGAGERGAVRSQLFFGGIEIAEQLRRDLVELVEAGGEDASGLRQPRQQKRQRAGAADQSLPVGDGEHLGDEAGGLQAVGRRRLRIGDEVGGVLEQDEIQNRHGQLSSGAGRGNGRRMGFSAPSRGAG